MTGSKSKTPCKTKFETRLFQASEAELVFRMLTNQHLDCTNRIELLTPYMLDESGAKILMSALEIGKTKMNAYQVNDEKGKAKNAKGAIEDLKAALCLIRVDQLQQNANKA